MNISQKTVTKVIQKQASVAHVLPFAPKHHNHNLVLRWNLHLPTFSLIALAMDFQQNKKARNPLQHIIPNLLKMHIVQDLICGRGIGYHKSL
jgi:hypothetical protein